MPLFLQLLLLSSPFNILEFHLNVTKLSVNTDLPTFQHALEMAKNAYFHSNIMGKPTIVAQKLETVEKTGVLTNQTKKESLLKENGQIVIRVVREALQVQDQVRVIRNLPNCYQRTHANSIIQKEIDISIFNGPGETFYGSGLSACRN